jgi:hypothetical protein
MGTIAMNIREKMRKESSLELYGTMAVSSLTHDSGTWKKTKAKYNWLKWKF